MHHEQDMRKMGGLRKYMPVTYWTSLIGALALIGTPFFSGFYSKDAIIEAVAPRTGAGSGYAYCACCVGVFVTALYTFRMIFMTFHGEERRDHHAQEHFHDVGWNMKGPLVALAIPSVLIGAFTIGAGAVWRLFWLCHPGAATPTMWCADLARSGSGALSFALRGLWSLPFWLAAAGVATAWVFFAAAARKGDALAARFSGLRTLLVNKYYFDWFNENVLIAPLARGLGTALWRGGDQGVIDGGMVNGSAGLVGLVGGSCAACCRAAFCTPTRSG